MQNVSTKRLIRRALRARVCTTCPIRPEGSESLGPTVTRKCEGTCTIFNNLEPLTAIAEQTAGDRLALFESAIRDSVCQTCKAAPSAGDYCSERLHCTCPLVLQAGHVLEVIESVLPARARAV